MDDDIAALIEGDPGREDDDSAPETARNSAAPSVERSSWSPVDLAPVLAGELHVEPPALLLRSDGKGLFYRNRLHAASGEPEGCKGWFTLHMAAEAIGRDEAVLMVDFEAEVGEAVDRLRALGVADEAIRERFHYVRPDEPLTDRGWLALESIVSAPLALAVFDGITEAMTLDALNPLDNADVAKWLLLPRRVIQRTGACGVLIDHVVKDKEVRGRYAIGAQHKLAGVDVAYSLNVVEPFGRGMNGEVEVNVKKDRPGHVRRLADGEQVATVRLVSEDDGAVQITVDPPVARAEFRPTTLMEWISEAIEIEPGIGKRDIREAVKGRTDAKDLALRLLVRDGYVKAEQDGRAIRHTNLRLYRQADDDLQVQIGVGDA